MKKKRESWKHHNFIHWVSAAYDLYCNSMKKKLTVTSNIKICKKKKCVFSFGWLVAQSFNTSFQEHT